MKVSQVSIKCTAAIALLAASVCTGAKQAKPVSYWPFKVGSTWTLTTHIKQGAKEQTADQVITVTSVSGGVATLDYKVNGNAVQGEKYRFDANQVMRIASGPNAGNPISPGLPVIKYPMKAGDHWKWNGTIALMGQTIPGSGELSVSGPEQVKTPGGAFQAMKVHLVVTISAQGQKIVLPNDYWFAPNVGLIKQVANVNGMQVDGELKSYKLK